MTTKAKPAAAPKKVEDLASFPRTKDFLLTEEFTIEHAARVEHARHPDVLAAPLPEGIARGELEQVVQSYLPPNHHGFHLASAGDQDEHFLVIGKTDLEAMRSHLRLGRQPMPESRGKGLGEQNSPVRGGTHRR